MTGRELILYISENHLENEEIFKHGTFTLPVAKGYMSVSETAAKYHVGEHTVRTWAALGLVNAIEIGNELYIKKEKK